MKTDSFKIGVDGGGTKTECIAVDARGEVVARHTGPGCNPSHVGADRAKEILTEALRSLLGQSAICNQQSVIAAALLCMAGSRAFWKEVAAELKSFGAVITADDSHPVLELATGGASGLVAHAGTGSFVAARAPDGSLHYAGGLGWRFGDPGSGMDIGRRGMARALLEIQSQSSVGSPLAGDGKTSVARSAAAARANGLSTNLTALAKALCSYAGLTDYTALSRFFNSDPDANAKIAGFAPRVIDLAEQGDAPAQQIVAESLNGLAGLVNPLLQRFAPAFRLRQSFGGQARLQTPDFLIPLGISGALLNRPPCFQALRALAATHGWPVELRPIAEPPIEGVRRLLAKM